MAWSYELHGSDIDWWKCAAGSHPREKLRLPRGAPSA